MRGIVLLPVLLLVACPTAGGGGWDEGQDDDDATSEDEAPVLGPGGSFGIWYWELPPPSGDGVMVGAGFIANFWEDLVAGTPGTPVNGPLDWDSPQGLDDCAVNTWDEADLLTSGGTPGVSDERDAGTITLSSPTWSVTIDPWERPDQQSEYYFELDPDYEVHFDTVYEVTAQGGDFPAFSSNAELLVPGALHLLDPLPSGSFELGSDPLEIRWSGGSEDRIWIELHHGSTLSTGNASIQCVAANDGAFTIPGDMIALLPPGELLNLTLGQPRNETISVGAIQVDVGSSASTSANGTRLP